MLWERGKEIDSRDENALSQYRQDAENYQDLSRSDCQDETSWQKGDAPAVYDDAISQLTGYGGRRSEPPPFDIDRAGRPVYAIGDIHGQLPQAVSALKAAQLVDGDENDWCSVHWTGKDSIVVSVGDVIDRGDYDDELLLLFDRLYDESVDAGGHFIPLLGNHEILNLAGHQGSYPKDFDGFNRFTRREYKNNKKARLKAFGCSGAIRRSILWRWPIAIKVGDDEHKSVFSHAGYTPDLDTGEPGDTYSDRVARLKQKVQSILRQGKKLPDWMTTNPQGHSRYPEEGPGSLVWTRRFAIDRNICEQAELALDQIEADAMYLGHTAQNHAESRCDGKVNLIDTHVAGNIELVQVYGRDSDTMQKSPQ